MSMQLKIELANKLFADTGLQVRCPADASMDQLRAAFHTATKELGASENPERATKFLLELIKLTGEFMKNNSDDMNLTAVRTAIDKIRSDKDENACSLSFKIDAETKRPAAIHFETSKVQFNFHYTRKNSPEGGQWLLGIFPARAEMKRDNCVGVYDHHEFLERYEQAQQEPNDLDNALKTIFHYCNLLDDAPELPEVIVEVLKMNAMADLEQINV